MRRIPRYIARRKGKQVVLLKMKPFRPFFAAEIPKPSTPTPVFSWKAGTL